MACLWGTTNHDLSDFNARPGERNISSHGWHNIKSIFIRAHVSVFKNAESNIRWGLESYTKKSKKLTIAIRLTGCCGFGGRHGCGKQFLEYVPELINSDKWLVRVSHLTEWLNTSCRSSASSTSCTSPQRWTIRCIYTLKVKLGRGGETLEAWTITCRDPLAFSNYISVEISEGSVEIYGNAIIFLWRKSLTLEFIKGPRVLWIQRKHMDIF